MRPKLITKQLRISPEIAKRLAIAAEKSDLAEADVYRFALEAGLEQIEAGKYNPFQKKAQLTQCDP